MAKHGGKLGRKDRLLAFVDASEDGGGMLIFDFLDVKDESRERITFGVDEDALDRIMEACAQARETLAQLEAEEEDVPEDGDEEVEDEEDE